MNSLRETGTKVLSVAYGQVNDMELKFDVKPDFSGSELFLNVKITFFAVLASDTRLAPLHRNRTGLTK